MYGVFMGIRGALMFVVYSWVLMGLHGVFMYGVLCIDVVVSLTACHNNT